MTGKMTQKMQEGMALAEEFLSTPKLSFQDLKPSDLPAKPGVYAIFCKDTISLRRSSICWITVISNSRSKKIL